MNILFSILILIASLLLILVVLMQKSKGGGLSSSFSSSNAILGYKKTTDFIEKITWILASVIIVLCVATVAVNNKLGNNAFSTVAPVQEQTTAPIVDDTQNVNKTEGGLMQIEPEQQPAPAEEIEQ